MVDSRSGRSCIKRDSLPSLECKESNAEPIPMDGDSDVATKSCHYNNLKPENCDESVANFKNISVYNSANVHFGNKTFYNGPVTIKQIVYSTEQSLVNDKRSCNGGNPEPQPTGKQCCNSETAIDDHYVSRFHTKDNQSTTTGQQRFNLFSSTFPDSSKIFKLLKCKRSKLCCYVVAFTIILVIVLLGTVIALVLKGDKNTPDGVVVLPASASEQPAVTDNFTLSGKLRIMQRQEWLAQPIDEFLPLTTPVPYVIISHTATKNCSSIPECVLQVRTIQTFHIESKKWWDIAYNFLVGGDGFVYTGRGWDIMGAHTYGYNNVSIGISFIGTFNSLVPPQRQLLAAQQLIELGVKLSKVSDNYKLFGHRQLTSTESPGSRLYNIIQKWPHWASKP